jgi:hypothetical protein
MPVIGQYMVILIRRLPLIQHNGPIMQCITNTAGILYSNPIIPPGSALCVNEGIVLSNDNSTGYTGGDAASKLEVTIVYTIESI